MSPFQIIAILITLTALLSYFNERTLKLPTTIGVMLISLTLSLALIAMGKIGFGLESAAKEFLANISFDQALMEGMLSFLLFAGALHVDVNELSKHKGFIGLIASAGVLLSTFIIGTGIHYLLQLLGIGISYPYALLFGALISPTDPIAVLGILKKAKVPKSLEIKVIGESLFNDGMGIILFIVLYEIAVLGHRPSPGHIALLFLLEAVGGVLLGLLMGWITYRLLKSVDNYQVEILLTLALVMGGYALASALHSSGPIAIVVAGLFIGNHGRLLAMSDRTRVHLDSFWELIDEILNAVLFVLIGLEVLALSFTTPLLIAGLCAIPLALLARLISIGLPVIVLSRWKEFSAGVIPVMTWGGLRGGISVALVLSLPPSHERELLLTVTYIVVTFSIMVQGLTLKRVASAVVSS